MANSWQDWEPPPNEPPPPDEPPPVQDWYKPPFWPSQQDNIWLQPERYPSENYDPFQSMQSYLGQYIPPDWRRPWRELGAAAPLDRYPDMPWALGPEGDAVEGAVYQPQAPSYGAVWADMAKLSDPKGLYARMMQRAMKERGDEEAWKQMSTTAYNVFGTQNYWSRPDMPKLDVPAAIQQEWMATNPNAIPFEYRTFFPWIDFTKGPIPWGTYDQPFTRPPQTAYGTKWISPYLWRESPFQTRRR